MIISKLRKEINDELTTMESQFGDMDIKRGLRAEIKKRENEQYSTFQTNIHDMCRDVLDKLEEQEALIKEMEEAASEIGLKWAVLHTETEDGWDSPYKGKWVKA